MLTNIVMAVAMSATMVPPGYPVANHGSPGTYTQPVLRTYERYEEDHGRRLAYDRYTRKLDSLWKQFRASGSTKEAFETYKQEVEKAKRDYVYADPYLAPVSP